MLGISKELARAATQELEGALAEERCLPPKRAKETIAKYKESIRFCKDLERSG